MPALENSRYERMAQELFKGASVVDAHERAGFKRNRGNAARVNALECVQRRVAELQGIAAARAVQKATQIDKSYVLQQAHRMFEASATAAIVVDETGETKGFDPKAANVAARFLDQMGNHVDVQAFSKQQDVSIRITVDSALAKLSALEPIEADYTELDGPNMHEAQGSE